MIPEEKEKIKKALSTAHQSAEAGKTPSQFSKNVMRSIRHLNSEKEQTDVWVLFQPVIWRFTSSAACIAIVLFTYVLQTGFLPEYEVAELFLESADIAIESPSNR